MEFLLGRFEEFKGRVACLSAEEDIGYYRESINLAWFKLDKYYRITDDCSVYLAATTLHLVYKLRFANVLQKDKPLWTREGREAVKKMWLEKYKNQELPEDIEEEVITS